MEAAQYWTDVGGKARAVAGELEKVMTEWLRWFNKLRGSCTNSETISFYKLTKLSRSIAFQHLKPDCYCSNSRIASGRTVWFVPRHIDALAGSAGALMWLIEHLAPQQ